MKIRSMEKAGVPLFGRGGIREAQRLGQEIQDKRAALALEDFEHGLRMSIDGFGMSADRLKLLEMAAGDARKGIAPLGAAALEAATKLVQMKEGLAVKQEVEDPMDAFLKKQADLQDLVDAGTISQNDFNLALTKAAGNLDQALGGGKAQLAGAALAGTGGAVSAINQFRVGTEDPQDRMRRLFEQANEQRNQQVEYAKRTVEALEQIQQQQNEDLMDQL
jgi:hypothetical protein